MRHGKVMCHSAQACVAEGRGPFEEVDQLWGRRLPLQLQEPPQRDGGKQLQPNHSWTAKEALHLPQSKAAGKDTPRPNGHAATCCQHTGRQVQRRAAAARRRSSLTSRHSLQTSYSS